MAEGRRLFLVMAAITVLVKLGCLFPMLDEHYSWRGKLLSVVIAVSVTLLWRGSVQVQRLAGWAFVLSGALTLLRFARSLESLDVYGVSVVFTLLLGLVDILAGLAILRLPALNAFFRDQREGQPDLIAPNQKRRVGAACGRGLVMGCGAGILIAAQWAQSIHFDLGFVDETLGILTGVGIGALLGLVAGLAVGFSGPGAGTARRQAMTRGLIAAAACVITVIVIAGVYGGLFGPESADFPAAPGLPRAAMAATLVAIFAGPMFAAAGFVLGVPIALLVRESGVARGEGERDPAT